MRRVLPGAMLASAVTAALILSGMAPAGADISLPGSLSTTPESWTPNVFAGTTNPTVCAQWFGPGTKKKSSCGTAAVLSTAVVGSEVVVAGAFTEACDEGPASSGHCAAGTTVTRDDLFAYQLGTGTIDPDFAPLLDQGPVYSVVAGPGSTVYVGGEFNTVDGASHPGIVQLNVTPGDSSTDGTVVTGFKASVSGYVRAMVADPTENALYIGGQFAKVDSTADEGDARLNTTTGAVDSAYHMPIGDTPDSGQALKVEAMSLTDNGSVLAIAGPFLQVNGQSRPRVALINTGGGVGDTATLANWAAPILSDNCSAEHDDVRGIDFSPSGNELVTADTGYKSATKSTGSPCDAAVAFPAAQTGTSIAPLWINYTGGDSFYSVQDTGSVIYEGGHNRLSNNECGNNAVCAPNAVLDMGFTAIDANTGLTIPWFQPLTLRGNGTMSLTTLPAGTASLPDGGILIGNDVDQNAGAYHSFNALFPIGSTTTSPAFGSIPSGLFAQGNIGGHDEGIGGAGTAAMCVTDTGGKAEFSTCTNAPAQNWTVESNGNIENNGLCLDTSGGQAVVDTCTSSSTQVWTQGTGNTLVNKASSLCLTDPSSSTTNGQALDVATCAGGTDQVWPLPVAPEPSSLTPDGPVFSPQFSGGGSSGQPECLTEAGSSKTPGTAVQLTECIGGTGMQVSVESNGNLEINGLCVDTAGQGTANGTKVVLNTCGSSSTQVWTQSSTGGTLVNKASGLCLNAPSVTKNTQLDIATCSGATTQKWRLPTM